MKVSISGQTLMRATPLRVPMHRPDFDRVADIYDETRGLPPRVLARIVGVLADELQGKRVLEIGVGTGRFAVPLQKSGIDVIGTDIAPRMVAQGRAKGLRNVVFADGARLPFPSTSFDAVTTNHVLHLIPDWRDVLREIDRVCDGTYFSVLQRATGERLGARYHDLARELGFDYGIAGFRERDLPESVPPRRTFHAISFSETRSARDAIASLERREYSSLWDVPEATHRRVIAALREEAGDRILEVTFDVEIAVWNAADVAAFAAATA